MRPGLLSNNMPMSSIWLIVLFLSYFAARHGIFFTENHMEHVFEGLKAEYNSNIDIYTSIEEVKQPKNSQDLEFFFHSDDKIIPAVFGSGKEVNIYFYKSNKRSRVNWANLENLSSYDVIFTETKADLQQFLKEANVVLAYLANHGKYVPLIRVLGPPKDNIEKIVKLAERVKREIAFKEYIQETLPIFKTKPLRIAAKSDNVAVIVESAVHPALELVVRNVMYYLESGWSLIIYHSEENEFFVKNALRDVANIEYRLPFSPVYSATEYNQFMKKFQFYESLNAKKVLLFQTDSIMLKKGIDRFMQYDYVGAPWPWFGRAGNGGFSLRSVDAMVRACALACNKENVDEPEDVILSEFVSREYKLVPYDVAYAFAREARVDALDSMSVEGGVEDGHMAVHQTWLFTDSDTVRKLFKKSIEDLKNDKYLQNSFPK